MSATAPAAATAGGQPTEAAPRRAATPYLRLDVANAVARFRRLAAALPGTDIHYAVKANPEPALLAALHAAGSKFDVASPAEVDATLSVGASASDLVHSNPVTRRSDLMLAAAQGIRLFVVDSLEETAKVASVAPGAAVLCRLVTSGEGSDWPLSCKFGCSTEQAVEVLRYAASVGLDAAGVSFHVGSQQRDPGRVGGADRGERPRVRAPRFRGMPVPAAGPRRWLPGEPGRRLPRPRDLRTRDRGVAVAAFRHSASHHHGRAGARHRRRRRCLVGRGARSRVPERSTLGLPRRGGLHRPHREHRRGDPISDRDRSGWWADRSVRGRGTHV